MSTSDDSLAGLHLGLARDDDGVVTLTLMPNPDQPRGGVVVLDDWLLDQIHLAFDAIEDGPAPTGFILRSGSERVFVAGADLAEIDALDDAELHRYLEKGARAFSRITALPCASVAAIHGAALGGGLEIAMHCDGLVGLETPTDAKPYPIGLPEAGLAICPGWGGTQMLPARIQPLDAITHTATGRTWKSSALPVGLLDMVVAERDHLDAAAREWLRENPRTRVHQTPRCLEDRPADQVRLAIEAFEAEMPDTDAARAVAECVRSGMTNGFATALETERRLLVTLRHTAAAREKLDAFLGRGAART